MRRAFMRDYPHHVILPNAGGWRDAHTSHAVAHLAGLKEWRWWTAGSDVDGSVVSVWGFVDLERALWFEIWASTCGIDWSVPPEEQAERPPRPPEPERKYGPSPAGRGSPR
jgi:hypothetical protein